MESQEKTKNPKMRKGCWISTVLVLVALAVFLYVRYFFVFGEGVKS